MHKQKGVIFRQPIYFEKPGRLAEGEIEALEVNLERFREMGKQACTIEQAFGLRKPPEIFYSRGKEKPPGRGKW